eukprot:11216297-Lingulodinium_polyedra.AAC.1
MRGTRPIRANASAAKRGEQGKPGKNGKDGAQGDQVMVDKGKGEGKARSRVFPASATQGASGL